jgi:hypothetical protein
MRLFSESGVVERALDTASTLDVSFGDSSCVFGEFSLPGGFVEYGKLVRGALCLDRRLRSGSCRGVLLVTNDGALCRGSRKDHLAAGNILNVIVPYLMLW